MVSNLITLVIMLAIGFIIWQVRKIKMAQADRSAKESKQEESLKAEGRKELRTEENIIERKEERKLQVEAQEADRKARVERDLREAELRRKIQDRKDHEADQKSGA